MNGSLARWILAVTLLPLALSAATATASIREPWLLSQNAEMRQRRCDSVKPFLHEGDLIFLRAASPLYAQIARLAGGWTSHLGIAFRVNDEWVVAESQIRGTRDTPLCDFVNRTDLDSLAIRRWRPELTTAQRTRLRVAAHYRLGREYDYGFDMAEPRKLFCSRFVTEVYFEALGVRLGRAQSFRDILNDRTRAEGQEPSMRFWRWWFKDHIPWERVTITPQSLYIDAQLTTVLDTTRPHPNFGWPANP